MISHFRRIYRKFGMLALLRTLLLLFGLVGMAVLGIVMLGRFDAAVIAIVGLALGAIFHRLIAERVELLTKVVPVGLFIYAVVLFLFPNRNKPRPRDLNDLPPSHPMMGRS